MVVTLFQSWPRSRWVSQEGLGAALSEPAPAHCWLKAPSLEGYMYGKGGAGNGHLQLHFKTFSCQALNAADPILSGSPVIPRGSETGWAWAAAGHDVGLHPPFKYLLCCVKTKYSWDWEMCLAAFQELPRCVGAGGGRWAARGVQGCVDWAPPIYLQSLCPTCAPGDSSHGCALLALPAAALGLGRAAAEMPCLLWTFPGDIASAAALL